MKRIANSFLARAITAILTCFFITSCTTKLINIPHTRTTSISKYLKPGDQVNIITIDNSKIDLKIKEISAERIIGIDKQVAIQEISSLQHKKPDIRKFGIIIGGIAYTLMVAMVAIFI